MTSEPPTGPDNLTRTTLGGLKWVYGTTALTVVLQIAYTATMARLLNPAAFGLFAMAGFVLRFGQFFATMGVGQAIVQRPNLTPRMVRAGSTSGVLLGLVATLLFWAIAPVAAVIYGTGDVVPVLQLAALQFALQGGGITPLALLRRQLRFRAMALVGLASHGVAYMTVGVVAAALGLGVWSLVLASLAAALLSTVLSYALVRHPVKPLIAWTEAKELYGFGGRVSVISFFEFLGISLDTVAVGRFAGDAALGYYNRALMLARLPLDQITGGLQHVLLPTFSRVQTELDRLRGAYLTAMRLTTALLLSTGAGVAVAAPELVRVVLGPQWDESIPLLRILVFAAIFSLLNVFAGILSEAIAALNRKLLLQLSFVTLLAALLLLARNETVVVIATMVFVAHLMHHIGYAVFMSSLIKLTPSQHVSVYAPAIQAAAAVSLAIWLVSLGVRHLVEVPFFVLLGQTVTGALTLALMLWFGPLVGIRREARERLRLSGVLQGGSKVAIVIDRLLTAGR